MSVDPFITFPENGQSLNPYSYVMNNPLKYTDPTGYATKIRLSLKARNKLKSRGITNVRFKVSDTGVISLTAQIKGMSRNFGSGASSDVNASSDDEADAETPTAPDTTETTSVRNTDMHPESSYDGISDYDESSVDNSLTAAVMPGPIPFPIMIPKTAAQKKSDAGLALALDKFGQWFEAQVAEAIYQFKKPSSASLNKTLTAAGFAKPAAGYEAHHIVPWDKSDANSVAARAILKKAGIGIHSATNLIWLPGLKGTTRVPGDPSVSHRGEGIHSTLYLQKVGNLLSGGPPSKLYTGAVLSGIKVSLRSGFKFWE